MDHSIKIGGEAGQGLQSLGLILAKAFCRAGYHIFTVQDYESRIRGGHSSFYLRFSDSPVEAAKTEITFLVCFDQPTLSRYQSDLLPSGYIIYNSDAVKENIPARNALPVPLDTLAMQSGNDKIYANAVALGAIIGLIGCDFNFLETTLAGFFGHKNKQTGVIEKNIISAKAGVYQKKTPSMPVPA